MPHRGALDDRLDVVRIGFLSPFASLIILVMISASGAQVEQPRWSVHDRRHEIGWAVGSCARNLSCRSLHRAPRGNVIGRGETGRGLPDADLHPIGGRQRQSILVRCSSRMILLLARSAPW